MLQLTRTNSYREDYHGFTLQEGFWYGVDTYTNQYIATSGLEDGDYLALYYLEDGQWNQHWIEISEYKFDLRNIPDYETENKLEFEDWVNKKYSLNWFGYEYEEVDSPYEAYLKTDDMDSVKKVENGYRNYFYDGLPMFAQKYIENQDQELEIKEIVEEPEMETELKEDATHKGENTMPDNTNQREGYPFTIPDKIKEPVIEDLPPIHIESIERDLSIRDLVDIIKLDGTYDAVQQALQEKEINEAEVNRILYWVNEKDQDRADRFFKEILNDIKSRPAYSEEWEELRESVAHDIKECNDKRRFREKQLDTLEQVMKNSTPESRPKIEEILQPQKDDTIKKLEVLTKQVSVLTMIQAESTSREAQEKAHEDIKNRLPLIQSIKESWQQRADYLRNMKEIVSNVKNISRPDRIEELANKEHLKQAKRSVKQYNKTRMEIKKKEDALIKLAQREVDKTWKSKHMQKLVHFSKGKELDPDLVREVKDIKTAEKVLNEKEYSDHKQHSIDKLRKEISQLKEVASAQEYEAETHLNAIAKVLDDRQIRLNREIDKEMELEAARNHGLGDKFDIAAAYQRHRFENEMEKAQEMTKIDRDLLKGSRFQKDLDMEGFMKDHGLEDIIEHDR